MNLADALVSQSHPDGSIIVSQGAPGDGMYFVEDGEVVISMTTGHDRVERKASFI